MWLCMSLFESMIPWLQWCTDEDYYEPDYDGGKGGGGGAGAGGGLDDFCILSHHDKRPIFYWNLNAMLGFDKGCLSIPFEQLIVFFFYKVISFPSPN